MTVDVHTHIFPDKIAVRAVETLVERANHNVFPVGDGTRGCLLSQMQDTGIDRAVLCPIATRPEQFEGILAEAVALRSGVYGTAAAQALIPFASVHPSDAQWQEHLAKVAKSGIRGIKLHPYYQECVIDSPQMLDFFRYCRELELVVQCHCGFDIGFPRERICDPQRVARVMMAVPGLKLIAAHLGGWQLWQEVERYLLGSDIYLDTSILPQDLANESVRRILREHPAERLLFATDWPWLDYPAAKNLINCEIDDITARNAIFGLNAMTLLGL